MKENISSYYEPLYQSSPSSHNLNSRRGNQYLTRTVSTYHQQRMQTITLCTYTSASTFNCTDLFGNVSVLMTTRCRQIITHYGKQVRSCSEVITTLFWIHFWLLRTASLILAEKSSVIRESVKNGIFFI